MFVQTELPHVFRRSSGIVFGSKNFAKGGILSHQTVMGNTIAIIRTLGVTHWQSGLEVEL